MLNEGQHIYLYATDLGLIKEVDDKIQPANPIYGELIACNF